MHASATASGATVSSRFAYGHPVGHTHAPGTGHPVAHTPPAGPGHVLSHLPYTVIDLETTGLSPREDRIVEIAIGRVEDGRLIDEWATLIDPDRDPGPTLIHHISAGMLVGAPMFRDIVGEILARLDGTIVVAHNAAFEEAFLDAELRRLGIHTAPMPALCTLRLSRAVLAAPNYKLATCCEICGIGLSDAHTALGDVRATSLLLPALLANAPEIRFPVTPAPLPRLPRQVGPRTRVTNLRKGQDGWMRSILTKLPYSMSDHDPVGAQPYLDALTEALADGKLTGDEARQLGRIAGRAGMGAAQLADLHRRFLDGLRDAVLVDDTVSAERYRQLTTTAALLDLPDYFADLTPPSGEAVIAPATAPTHSGPRVWCGPGVPAQARQRLSNAGYRLAGNITRTLVAAIVDPADDTSAQAQRAAQLGVRILRADQIDELLRPTGAALAGEADQPTGAALAGEDAFASLPAPVAPAGWYPDQAGRYAYRYWTGAAWTEYVSPGDGMIATDTIATNLPHQRS